VRQLSSTPHPRSSLHRCTLLRPTPGYHSIRSRIHLQTAAITNARTAAPYAHLGTFLQKGSQVYQKILGRFAESGRKAGDESFGIWRRIGGLEGSLCEVEEDCRIGGGKSVGWGCWKNPRCELLHCQLGGKTRRGGGSG